jgi:predicted O-methyltransferase YrrM
VEECYQNEWELKQLVAIYRELDVYSALEVGAMYGGSLRRWLGRGTTVVVVDDQMRRAAEWERWASSADANLVLLQGQSNNTELVWKAADLGPYQFVFIDADHTYEAVREDWENFSPMVGKDGVVAFHDIVERPGYGVSYLWDEIKAQPKSRTVEIIGEPVHEYRCGIGVVWMSG